jgi:hypothetical protein
VALQLSPRMESVFHQDSYGYRPRRSPLMAVTKCRERCWKKDWVLDLDVQKFFDSVDHNLMVKAVEANTDQKWVVLYVRRWLTAPMQMPDGTVVGRDCGTPQGSAVSPILANETYSRASLLIHVGVANRATSRISEEWSSDARSPERRPAACTTLQASAAMRSPRVVCVCSCDWPEFWR